MIEVITNNFPEWALCYVVNGDTEGLTDKEVRMIDNYIQNITNLGFVSGCYDFSEESHFCHYPEFGLGCDCVIMKGVINYKNDKY